MMAHLHNSSNNAGDSLLVTKHDRVAKTLHRKQRLPLAKTDRSGAILKTGDHFVLRPTNVLHDLAESPSRRVRSGTARLAKPPPQSRRPGRRGGPELRRCPLDRGAPTNRRSPAPPFGNRPEQRSGTSSLASIPRLLIRPFLSRNEGSVYQIVSLFFRV